MGGSEQYHITERWRGVEQPLDNAAAILDIWNAWGTAQPEVILSKKSHLYKQNLLLLIALLNNPIYLPVFWGWPDLIENYNEFLFSVLTGKNFFKANKK